MPRRKVERAAGAQTSDRLELAGFLKFCGHSHRVAAGEADEHAAGPISQAVSRRAVPRRVVTPVHARLLPL